MSSTGQNEPHRGHEFACRTLSVWLSFGYNDAAIIEVESEAVMLALDSDFPALETIRPMDAVIARGHEWDVASRCLIFIVGQFQL